MVNLCKTILFIAILLVSVTGYSQCNAPVNLNTSYSNNVSTFTWDTVPGAVSYNLELKFIYDNWGTGEYFTSNTNSFDIAGLFHSAALEWRVSTDCGTSFSANSASKLYTVPCPQPSAPNVTNITGTTATINWTAAAGYNTTVSNFAVSYRLANTTNAWTSAGTTSTTSKNIAGLISNTTYEYCINQSCINSNSSPIFGQFTTAYIPCDIPVNLNITGATNNQATISWNAVSGGQTYTVEYKPTTSTNWIVTSSVTNNNKVLTGLSQATLYDVRVKATCTNGFISGYVAKQFTTYTTVCQAYGTNTSEFIDQFTIGTINRISGREIGGYINTGLTTNLRKGSTNAGVFSGGYNPGIIFGENYAVYIDFNNNGNFTDNGECVVQPTYFATGAPLNFNLSIPNNASQGLRKMRVVVRRSTGTINPCVYGFQGEVEDYTVNIVNQSNKSSIEEITEQVASVYPNPTTGIINISGSDKFKPSFVEVMSVDGRIIDKFMMDHQSLNKIDISSQMEGIYIINITSEGNERSSHRVILTK